MSKTYTWGTTPDDVIRESLPHKYDMRLNKTDMVYLLTQLMVRSDDDLLADWAVSFRMSILETIGIEEV